jgi:hypothetical protein
MLYSPMHLDAPVPCPELFVAISVLDPTSSTTVHGSILLHCDLVLDPAVPCSTRPPVC